MSTLKVNSIIPVAGVPTGGGGGIIQVKRVVLTSGTMSTSSTSFVDITGLSVDITPTSTSSKILVFFMGGEFGMYSGGAYYATVQLLRDSTELFNSGGNVVTSREGSGNQQSNASFSILDSPNTTSQITYKGQVKSSNSSKTVYVTNSGAGFPSITVMEVSA